MIIHATDKHTKLRFDFESTTADSATLDRVEITPNMPNPERLAFFDRRKALDKAQKIAILVVHRDRLKTILQDMLQRAPGSNGGEVRTAIVTTKDKCVMILEKYKGFATRGDKAFTEMKLADELRLALIDLKGKVPDRATDDQHVLALTRARNQVGDVLARAEAGIRAWVRDASIAYRGSLATGWRNETKSMGGIAQPINLFVFDSDAFVTVPNATWLEWHGLGIVPDRKRDDKVSLPDLIHWATQAPKVDALPRVQAQLAGIRQVETRLCDAMKTVKGYKLDPPGAADFGFVLQPASKTAKELVAGNLYPLGEIAFAGLPLAETDLELVVESGVIKVRMPERHISMSNPVLGKTYPADADSPPHTSHHPTERMCIDQYFAPAAQFPTLRPVQPTVRNLTAHFAHHNDNMVFDMREGI